MNETSATPQEKSSAGGSEGPRSLLATLASLESVRESKWPEIRFRYARLVDITKYLQREHYASTMCLRRLFGVSAGTMRRDLKLLKQWGYLSLERGGAIWKEWLQRGDGKEPPAPHASFEERLKLRRTVKEQLARAACRIIRSGNALMLDSSSTVACLAERLVAPRLEVVTHSLWIAQRLGGRNIMLIVVGGQYEPHLSAMVGPAVEQTLQTFSGRRLLMSAAAISNGQIYSDNALLAPLQRIMIEQAEEVILLADSLKFHNRGGLARVGSMQDVDTVITDRQLLPGHRGEMEAADVKVFVAE